MFRGVILSEAKNLALKRINYLRDPSSPSAPQDDTPWAFFSNLLKGRCGHLDAEAGPRSRRPAPKYSQKCPVQLAVGFWGMRKPTADLEVCCAAIRSPTPNPESAIPVLRGKPGLGNSISSRKVTPRLCACSLKTRPSRSVPRKSCASLAFPFYLPLT